MIAPATNIVCFSDLLVVKDEHLFFGILAFYDSFYDSLKVLGVT